MNNRRHEPVRIVPLGRVSIDQDLKLKSLLLIDPQVLKH